MPSDIVDVAIIGAGPAGSTVAQELAKRGFEVALLEEHERVGLPQHCAGMLTKKACSKFHIEVPDHVIQAEPSRLLLNYARLSVEARFDLYILDRAAFDQYLALRAQETGARLLTKSRVVGIRREGPLWKLFTSPGRELRARLVVGADGYKALSVRWVGLKRPGEVASCLQYELEVGREIDTDLVVCSFGSTVAPGGYAWVVPIGPRRVRIGLGVRKAPRPAKHYLDALLAREFPGSKVIRRLAGLVSTGGPMRPSYTDAFLAVGEAAGQVNPLVGSGIASAIACGRIAGQVASRALEEEDLSTARLSEYERSWWKTIGRNYELAMRIRELLERMPRDKLVKLASGASEDLGRGRLGSALLKLLIREPSLIKYLLRWRTLKEIAYF